ncbi:late exocytosis, associated with Golgi transport-domain-containing protein [Haematococcus lacustris]
MDPSPSSVLDGLGSSLISMPDNNVSDANIKSAVVVDIALGVALMGLFVILQARSILYKIRLVSPYVSLRPPPLPTGVSALWAWLVAAAATSDAELLESCGLDAMMLVKMHTFGIQLVAPIAVLGLAIRES